MQKIRLIPTPGWESKPSQELDFDCFEQNETVFEFDALTKIEDGQDLDAIYSYDGYEVLQDGKVLFYEKFRGRPFTIPLAGGTIAINTGVEICNLVRGMIGKFYTDQDLKKVLEDNYIDNVYDKISPELILNQKIKKRFQAARKAKETARKAEERKQKALNDVVKILGLYNDDDEELDASVV